MQGAALNRAAPLAFGLPPNDCQTRRDEGKPLMQVFVRDNDLNSALRVLKKKMQREGTFREMKRRRAYEKPSERRVREKAEAIRRHRKMLRKRLEREGY
jgi:small subunit ribosomal protein S21